MTWMIVGLAVPWLIMGLFVILGCWLGFQLVHQNGRLLAHLEALEQRLGLIPTSSPAPPLQGEGGMGPGSSIPRLQGEGRTGPGSPIPCPQGEGWPNPGGQAVPAPPPPAPAHPEGTRPALPLGAPAPAFELPDLAGRRHSLAGFRGRKLLLIFFSPRCGFCTRMAPDLAALPLDGAAGAPLPLVVTTGEVEENRKLVEEHGIRAPVLRQQGMEIASQYQCNGTPMGYLLDAQGKIASELGVGAPALLALAGDGTEGRGQERSDARGATGRPDAESPLVAPSPRRPVPPSGPLGGKRELSESKLQRDGLPAGTPAPDFRLPLLHGGALSLSEYRGRRVLLVFSDPGCAPCDQLAPQLEQLARRPPGLHVLMVSRGEPEANRAKAAQHGLTFPIVLQRQWEISREYGKFATPIGYLIDEEGIIAKEVAAGVEPILSLLPQAPVAPSNGKGKVARRGKELARRR